MLVTVSPCVIVLIFVSSVSVSSCDPSDQLTEDKGTDVALQVKVALSLWLIVRDCGDTSSLGASGSNSKK